MIEIVDLSSALASQAAEILVLAFRVHWSEAWPTLKEGLAEVNEMLAPERIARAAVDETGRLLGWIGGLPQYAGHVWELHPLAVHPVCVLSKMRLPYYGRGKPDILMSKRVG